MGIELYIWIGENWVKLGDNCSEIGTNMASSVINLTHCQIMVSQIGIILYKSTDELTTKLPNLQTASW